MFPACDIATSIQNWLSGHREKLNKLKVQTGMSPDSPDKFTRERWEIVQGKLFILDALQSSIPDLVESLPPHLTGEKSIFSSIEATAKMHDLHAAHYRAFPDARAVLIHESKAKALRSLLSSLSGSAGTQPKTSEEAAESGPCLETPPPNPPLPGPPVPFPASWMAFFYSLPMTDLISLSDLALLVAEDRGVCDAWEPAFSGHSGVGEGDSSLPGHG